MKRILFALLLLWPGASFAAELIQHLPDEFCLDARSAASADEQMLQWTQCLASEPLKPKQRAIAYTARAVLFERKQNYTSALADFNSAIAADPTLAIAYAGRGTLYLAMNNSPSAITDFTLALKLDPAMTQAYLARGTALLKAGRSDEAIADFTTVIQSEPKLTLAALELRALAFAAKKNWSGTIADCTAAMKLSNDVTLYEIRAAAYVNNNQDAKAIPDFNAVIAREPGNAIAYNNRAVAYGDLRKYDLAIADLSKAISISPVQPIFYEGRGSNYDQTGDCKSAVADFDSALALAQDGLAYNGKAWVRATCPDSAYRNGAEALTLAIKAIKLGAGDAQSDEAMATALHMTLAAAYAENAQFDDALHEQELAIQLLTDDARDILKDEAKLALRTFKAKKPFRWPADQLIGKLADSVVASGFVGVGHSFAPVARNAPSPILRTTIAMPPPPPLPPLDLPY